MTYRREATWSKELRQRYATPEATVHCPAKSEPVDLTGMSRVSAGELRVGNGKTDDRPQMSIWATIKNEVLLFWEFWGLGI